MKHCSKCGITKPVTEFHKDKGKNDGLFTWCKSCASSNAKNWQANNHERVIQNVTKYDKAHPEYRKTHEKNTRARKRASLEKITNAQWQVILEEFDYLCAYCNASWEHQDHLIPLSKGGTHTADNVVPACASCNTRKSNKLPLDFINEKA